MAFCFFNAWEYFDSELHPIFNMYAPTYKYVPKLGGTVLAY